MEDYKDIIEFIRPRRDIKASNELRKKVKEAFERDRRHRTVKNWLFGGISLSAVASLLILVLISSGMSAKEILREAIDALGVSENIEMVVEVRTRPVENFRYINIDNEFVAHSIQFATSDSLLIWRVDKGERIAVGKGNDIYTWMPSLNLGWHIENSDKENVLGYLANFLTPRKILETELDNCINHSNAEYKVERKGNDLLLTVHTPPQGNFDNPYMLNTSIAESESIRRYIIDANSKRLKSATVSIRAGDKEIEVLKVSSIKYGSKRDEICKLDDRIKFVEVDNQPSGLIDLSAEEAASTVLNAFADWNESILDKVIIREISDAAYRDKFQGSKLLSIGHSFKSGNGNSVFVPYTLKLRDGTLQRHNIALQKTEYGGWIIVGGL